MNTVFAEWVTILLTGVSGISPWGIVLYTLALTHLSLVSMSLYLHRHLAHTAVDFHPAVAHFFRFWLWLTTGVRSKEWVAVHRKHHARVETTEDPHSPRILGINKVLWEGTELYQHEAGNPDTLRRYGQGTPQDWLERHLYSPRNWYGLILLLLFDVIMFGAFGLSVWAAQMLWTPFFAAGVLNGLAHYWGYRNYPTPDASTNLLPFGLLLAGEELHNNHHAHPGLAKLSAKRWEVDIGWGYIRLLAVLGLAQVKIRGA